MIEELKKNPTDLVKCSEILKYYPELYDEIERISNYKITIENKEECYKRFEVMCRKSEFYKELISKGLDDETSHMIMESNMENQRAIIVSAIKVSREACLKILELIRYINNYDKRETNPIYEGLIYDYNISIVHISESENAILADDVIRLIETVKNRIQYFDIIKTDYLHHSKDWMVIKVNEIDMRIAFEKIKNILNSFPEPYNEINKQVNR